MTRDDLDQIAIRMPDGLLDAHGCSRLVVLSEAERDALVALAREGLAAREHRQPLTFETMISHAVYPDICLYGDALHELRNCGFYKGSQVAASGPDGTP